MTGLVVTGFGVLSPAGIGAEALDGALAGRTDVPAVAEDGFPPSGAYRLDGFRIRDHLGRKGTSTLDRCTGMAVVACGQALADSGIEVDDGNRRRIGVALGTTMGSFQSTSEYSRETLVQERPYLVNPMLFPNTVMNCAAGQCAIWHGLKGVNATLAGGPLAFFSSLRYAANALNRGYADTVLCGAVEELTGYRAWANHLGGGTGTGEGAAVLALERQPAPGRRVVAEILAVTTGFAPDPGTVADALAGCVARALHRAGLAMDGVALVVTGAEDDVLRKALPDGCVPRLSIAATFGECDAASGALQAAAVLAGHRSDPSRDGQVSLLAGYTARGGVAAVLLRGWSGGGTAGR